MWQLLIVVGGAVAVLSVTAVVWETRPALRCLPIVYGIFIGLITQYSKGGLDPWEVLEGVTFGVVAGLLGMFVIWISGYEK